MKEYDDIINLPHHVSKTRPQMSQHNRAAQFSPFAALTGHEAAIQETARLTDEKLELSEDRKIQLDEQLRLIRERIDEKLEVSITYFEADKLKHGGKYRTVQGIVRKVDAYQQMIVLDNGLCVAIADVYAIEVG